MTQLPRTYRLQNPIQHYAWGTRDEAAFIPRLLGQVPEPGLPYAELWMGAHPQAPSLVHTETGPVSLHLWLERSPESLLGDVKAFPFLFKVLSIAEPLSIQAHPDAALAARLHARDPQHYPDPNPKPEMVIALDTLRALVGFAPPATWPHLTTRLPELMAFVPHPLPQTPEDLRRWYTALVQRMRAEPAAALLMVDALTRRLRATASPSPQEALFLTLKERVAGADVGLVTLLLLNDVTLRRGEALALTPGLPHAYLRGNALELMANSDNVVRAGLTSKFVDLDAWLEVLDFAMGGPRSVGQQEAEPRLRTYHVPEARLGVSWLSAAARETFRAAWAGPALLLVLQGAIQIETGEVYRQGEVAFLPATPAHVTWRQVTEGEVVMAATAPVKVTRL